jgi:hypothetical protein
MTISFGVPCLSNVVRKLRDRADNHPSQDELKWFAETLDHAEFIAGNLSGSIENRLTMLVVENN